jgi:NADPH-dependent ferric siderophore reductase
VTDTAHPDAPDALAEYLDEVGSDVLAHLNGDFADSTLFVGRVLGERPEATACRMVALDSRGVDAVVTDPEGDHEVRIDFDEPVSDPTALTLQLLALVERAREVSGEDGATSGEQEMEELAAIRTFVTSVVAVRDVHPHLREITFGGGDLVTFTPNGPDAFVYVLLPPPGRTELTIDQSFGWEDYGRMPEEERPVGAYYTVRQWRPETSELVALFVLHGDEGPASAWAGRVQVGDPVALWGPRTAWEPPADTDHYLLVADETGLPAVAGVLDLLPAGTSIQVVAEVGSLDERQPLPDHPGATVTWVSRDGADAGTATSLLVDAVRELPWGGDRSYVFGGGESRALTKVRRFVRDEKGLDKAQVSLVAYWRHADDPDPVPSD